MFTKLSSQTNLKQRAALYSNTYTDQSTSNVQLHISQLCSRASPWMRTDLTLVQAMDMENQQAKDTTMITLMGRF